MDEKSIEAYRVDTIRLNHALNGKVTHCPVCGKPNTFTVMPTLMELREFHYGGLVVGGSPIVPLAVLTCQNCGNTLLFNALATGLIDNPQTSGDT